MTYNFGDSFDLYTLAADLTGYWDVYTPTVNPTVAGRFPGSRALQMSSTGSLAKNGANDAVHHIFCAYSTNQPISGASTWQSFQLFDGTTAQCSIWFRSDGAIILSSGSPAGAVLATYAGAVTAQNVWYGFEFEVVIGSGGAGSFAVRKNGNAANDFTATGLNTQVSANAYANKLVLGNGGNSVTSVDDLYWRSGAAAGAWLGELRACARMPQADVSVQFTGAPSTLNQTVNGTALNNSVAASAAHAVPVVATYTGVLTGGLVNLYAASTGNMKFALYNAAGTTLLATSNPITNPPINTATPFTFPTPPAIVKGQTYYLAHDQDSTINCNIANTGLATTLATTLAYASFPPATLAGWTSGSVNAPAMIVTFTGIANSSLVSEPQQDGLATYVYDSNPGDTDLYAIAGLPTATPFSTVATITRGYMTKSDAGTRTAAIKLLSGATTVATPTLTLTNSGWQWASRLDIVDPATSAAWTAAAVSALQVGPTVVA
jgi:hypothetical protein